MTTSRIAVCRRIPVGTCLVLVALVLSLLASAGPAYASTHLPATTYTSNTTWTAANSPYVLDGNVTVAAGVTLTIEPGVIVKFNGTLRELRINGTLSAVGTSGSHIVFTSYQDDTAGGDTNGDGSATTGAPGQWYMVNVTSGNSGSQLRYADVRYGGWGTANEGYGALRVATAGTSVIVEDSTFSNNQRSGIFVSTQQTDGATVRRTTLSNNGNGISVNMGWVKVEDNSSIRTNSEDGLWFNLTSTFTGTQSSIADSEVRDNGRDGVRLTVDANLDVSRWPRGTRNNIYNNAVSNSLGKQLYTLNTKRTADWKTTTGARGSTSVGTKANASAPAKTHGARSPTAPRRPVRRTGRSRPTSTPSERRSAPTTRSRSRRPSSRPSPSAPPPGWRTASRSEATAAAASSRSTRPRSAPSPSTPPPAASRTR